MEVATKSYPREIRKGVSVGLKDAEVQETYRIHKGNVSGIGPNPVRVPRAKKGSQAAVQEVYRSTKATFAGNVPGIGRSHEIVSIEELRSHHQPRERCFRELKAGLLNAILLRGPGVTHKCSSLSNRGCC